MSHDTATATTDHGWSKTAQEPHAMARECTACAHDRLHFNHKTQPSGVHRQQCPVGKQAASQFRSPKPPPHTLWPKLYSQEQRAWLMHNPMPCMRNWLPALQSPGSSTDLGTTTCTTTSQSVQLLVHAQLQHVRMSTTPTCTNVTPPTVSAAPCTWGNCTSPYHCGGPTWGPG
jgi:hypothetical protein